MQRSHISQRNNFLFSRLSRTLTVSGIITAIAVFGWLIPGANAAVTFTEQTVDSANSGDSKAVGDISGDGKPDLVLGGSTSNNALVWYQWASGDTYTKHVIRTSPVFTEFSTDMQLADIDGDGDLDIVVGDGGSSNNVMWFKNPRPSGNPTTGSAWTQHTIGTHGDWAHDLEVGDIDNDGRIDVVTGGHGKMHVFFQGAGQTWTDKNLSTLAGAGMGLGDIDGDGDLDIAIPTGWLEAPSDPRTGTWIKRTITNAAGETAHAVDMNGDGRPDIVTIKQHGGGTFAWYEQPTDPTSSAWTQRVIDSNHGAHKIEAADFNNDGRMDLLAGLEKGNVSIFLQNGDGSFTKQVLATTGGHNARAGDIGADGDIDVMAVDYAGNPPVKVFRNTASASNQAPKVVLRKPTNNATFASGATVSLVAEAYDGDGAIAKVEFYHGATKIGEDVRAPYAISWSPANGSYSVTAKVTDNRGTTTTSAAVSITVGGGTQPSPRPSPLPGPNAVYLPMIRTAPATAPTPSPRP